MYQNLSITCPSCQTNIPLTETLARPIVEAERTKLQHEYDAKIADAEQKELEARQQHETVVREKRNLELTIIRRLDEERQKLRQEAAEEEQQRWRTALAERDCALAEKDAKLRQAEQAELAIRKERQSLEDEKRTLELTVERRLDEERVRVREIAKKEDEDNHRLKLAEKDKIIEDMRKQVEELRRKSDQGSQQLQGEVQEVELESLLKNTFPNDEIEAVQNGRSGGDLIHKVIGSNGLVAGTILWESKRTKNWSDTWLPKNREDQRRISAHIGVIVSATLPKGIDTFTQIEGVWVSTLQCALPLALVLRHALIQTAIAHLAEEGRAGKMELMYGYVTGQNFRQRVAAIVEAYLAMRSDLDAEKRAITKHWAKRERQLELVVTNIAGMYGDMQGIVGKTMPEVEGLEIPLLGERTSVETLEMTAGQQQAAN